MEMYHDIETIFQQLLVNKYIHHLKSLDLSLIQEKSDIKIHSEMVPSKTH